MQGNAGDEALKKAIHHFFDTKLTVGGVTTTIYEYWTGQQRLSKSERAAPSYETVFGDHLIHGLLFSDLYAFMDQHKKQPDEHQESDFSEKARHFTTQLDSLILSMELVLKDPSRALMQKNLPNPDDDGRTAQWLRDSLPPETLDVIRNAYKSPRAYAQKGQELLDKLIANADRALKGLEENARRTQDAHEGERADRFKTHAVTLAQSFHESFSQHVPPTIGRISLL